MWSHLNPALCAQEALQSCPGQRSGQGLRGWRPRHALPGGPGPPAPCPGRIPRVSRAQAPQAPSSVVRGWGSWLPGPPANTVPVFYPIAEQYEEEGNPGGPTCSPP